MGGVIVLWVGKHIYLRLRGQGDLLPVFWEISRLLVTWAVLQRRELLVFLLSHRKSIAASHALSSGYRCPPYSALWGSSPQIFVF